MTTYRIHAQARTTPKVRQEIQSSNLTVAELAAQYNIHRHTASKWKRRTTVEDASHRPHRLQTTLTPVQEAILLELRTALLLPLDDLVAVTKQFINPAASRAGIHRCLKRHGMENLRAMQRAQQEAAGEGKDAKIKTFKDYEPGFLHIDIKYLPRMPDEQKHRYLFVAIDRATRWVYLRIYADQTEVSACDFLRRARQNCPVKIQKVLTDNGTQFTDRFTSADKKVTGEHAFDKECARLQIEHRLSPPRHPQTNGMVERFNGRISEVVGQTRFASAAELERTLLNYMNVYNQHIPQRALGHKSPVEALKEWQKKRPEIFLKRVYKQAELDK